MSVKQKIMTINSLTHTLKRVVELTNATFQLTTEPSTGTDAIIRSVLREQLVEIEYAMGQAERLAEDVGVAA